MVIDRDVLMPEAPEDPCSLMGMRACVLSDGLWRLRETVAAATGLQLVKRRRSGTVGFDCVAGWGRKASAEAARAFALRCGLPYVALEDGFLRSLRPGPGERPLSLVCDPIGVHYDATAPSGFEAAIELACTLDAAREERARRAMAYLREQRLSKYNHAPMLSETRLGLKARRAAGRVLVIDQTRGDAAIAFGRANAARFGAMLAAAIAENPGAQIIVKVHPETVLGRKRGHLKAAGDGASGVRIMAEAVNPWALIEAVDTVYTVTSLMGFEALIAGREVHCFGAPFYAGWGLTRDRVAVSRRTVRPSLTQLFAAAYFDYARYAHPKTNTPLSFEEAAVWLKETREAHLAGRLPIPRARLGVLRGRGAIARRLGLVAAASTDS